MDPAITKAIADIADDAWVDIKYPQAIFDDEQQRWISDAQVAETTYTAFTSKPRKHQVTARLIVRRVKRLNPATSPKGQGGTVHRLPVPRRVHQQLRTDADRRGVPPRHAIVEQVIADLKS